MGIQLPLGIRLRDAATFDNYVAGPNGEALEFLRRREPEARIVYLWGAPGTGKTHLLQASCQDTARNGAVAYLPLARADELAPAMLEGLEEMALVCVDDVQAISAETQWETALFHLFNRVRDVGGRLVVAGDAPVRELGLQLPDLATRLGWGLVFQLRTLSDEHKAAALQLRAGARGLVLGDEVVRFLLRRFPRDTSALFALLDHLDEASLAAQRRITIPFVKQLLDQD